MKDFFELKDCNIRHFNDPRLPMSITIEEANRLLKERGQVVYGLKRGDGLWEYNDHPHPMDTHQALLICIEPIEAPDTAEKFVRDFLAETGGKLGVSLNRFLDRAKKLLEEK